MEANVAGWCDALIKMFDLELEDPGPDPFSAMNLDGWPWANHTF